MVAGFCWRAFGWRLGQIVMMAGLIARSTWFLASGSFIYFGVLHCVTAASVISRSFLRCPRCNRGTRHSGDGETVTTQRTAR